MPLDGSPAAEAALPIARALARASGAALTLLRAARAHLEPKPRPAEEGLAGIREAETYLTEIRRRLVAGGAGEVAVSVWCGDPAPAILEAAVRYGADLIVMTTSGRSGRHRDMFGSVAESVLGAAAVPVLVLRPGATARSCPS